MNELIGYRQPKIEEDKGSKSQQLHIMLTKENYERIKKAAKNRNMTISLFVMSVVMQQVIEDESYM
jgi:uncharacterized protein (DUF1778 family)